jgi:acyl-CoA synthetase (AMP-forming)/AMP-acid ligase II
MSRAKSTIAATESVYASGPWLDHYNYWTPPHMNYPRRPLHEILRITAAEVPHRPATAFLGQHLTFIQLRDQADRFATALSRLGIEQGDRVGVMLANCPQYVIAAFALFRLGAIVVNVNPIYTPREVLVVAKDSGMRALLTLNVLAPQVLSVRDQTAIKNIIITSLGEYSAAGTPTPVVEGTVRMAELLNLICPASKSIPIKTSRCCNTRVEQPECRKVRCSRIGTSLPTSCRPMPGPISSRSVVQIVTSL